MDETFEDYSERYVEIWNDWQRDRECLIANMEAIEQQNAELLDAVRKSQSAAEKIKALLMMDGSLSAGKIRGHLATIQVECGLANEAIAKAGDKT